MSVLIVEDDLSTCDLMTRFLSRHGHTVVCANTLAEGLRLLDGHPCGVVLDLALPDGSGLSLLRHVRDAHLPIPVAVVTGAAGAALSDAALMRPSALFTKPVDIGELLSWVRHVCPAA
jgi:DNA-binding response OmpR family regulator